MVEEVPTRFLERPRDGGGGRLAYRHRPAAGKGPTVVFLPGYASDMTGGKATALDAWAAKWGCAMLRLDYAGCGESDGDFEAQTLTGWRDDALALIDRLVEGPVILVGSSMGGWLMLLVAKARPTRVRAMVGVAAAADFTGWGFTEEEKLTILREGRLARPGDPDADGRPTEMVTSRAFFQSGEASRVLHAGVPFDGPVRLLHGQRDAAVPWQQSLALADALSSADVQVVLVKDGDHRLSRPADVDLLIRTVAALTV